MTDAKTATELLAEKVSSKWFEDKCAYVHIIDPRASREQLRKDIVEALADHDAALKGEAYRLGVKALAAMIRTIIPAFDENKVIALQDWLNDHDERIRQQERDKILSSVCEGCRERLEKILQARS